MATELNSKLTKQQNSKLTKQQADKNSAFAK
jgi:hypothetical protein